jgi:hypothetical protein
MEWKNKEYPDPMIREANILATLIKPLDYAEVVLFYLGIKNLEVNRKKSE